MLIAASLFGIFALLFLLHSITLIQTQWARKRCVVSVVVVLLLLSAILNVAAADKVADNATYMFLQYSQNAAGKVVLALLLGIIRFKPNAAVELNRKYLSYVFLANEAHMVLASCVQRERTGDNDIANKFLVASVFGAFAAVLFYRTVWTDFSGKLYVGVMILISLIVTADLAAQVATTGFASSFPELAGFYTLMYMPYVFTRLHMPFYAEQLFSQNQPASSSEPELNSDLRRSDDANGGISVVEVNTTTDNLPTAVAIPIAG